MKIPEKEHKIEKKFFVFKIIAFEEGTATSHNPRQDTSHGQSMSEEKNLSFLISAWEIFSKSFSLIVMKKYDKSFLKLISPVFGTISHVHSQSKF